MTLKKVAYALAFIVIIGINLAIYGDDGTSGQPGKVSSQPSATLASYGSWSAIEGGGDFTETSTSGEPEFAFTLPEGSQHFVISLFNDDKNMPSGTSIPIRLSFNDGSTISLVGSGSELELKANLPDELVAQWTHHFTADETMTVSFPNSSEAPWQFQLSGTTQTITALAKGIEAAGITGLPAPWTTSGNSTPAQAASTSSDQDASIPALTLPYGPQDVWTGPIPDCSSNPNLENCLKEAMIASNASPQALAFAASGNFDYFLSEFQSEGAISPGIITEIGSANNNDQPVLLNGKTPMIQVWNLTNPPVMDLSELKKTHPNAATDDHPPTFISSSNTADGGQAFTYDVTVSDCHVCDLAEYNETLTFDSNGNLVGNTAVLTKQYSN